MNRPQLFCFTCAGGNASFFDVIERDLPEIEIIKVEYPGHGARHKEPFCNSFDELADDIFINISSMFNGNDYTLLGYSMGAITLIEVLKRILKLQKMRKPSHIFLAAHEPHIKDELMDFSDIELDEWVKDRTIRFGGIPDKLLNNKSFWRMYLPIYRADYSLIGKYKFEEMDFACNIPTTIFYSEADTPRTEMELWKKYFNGKCDFYQYDGTHFFIQEHHIEMAEVISRAFREGNEYI